MGKTTEKGAVRKHVLWAKNMTELAANLNPPRERARLSELMKHPECPGKRQNGHYHVPKWQAFIDKIGMATKDMSPPATTARREGLDLDNELKRIKLDRERGDSIHREDAMQTLGKMISELARGLDKLCDEMSGNLVGLGSAGEVKKRLRKALRETLVDYSTITEPATDDAKKKAFWKRLCAEWPDLRTRLLSGSGLSDM